MDHLSDYIRFGAVSKSWRSAITINPRPLHLRFPLLFLSLITTTTDEERCEHALYSPFERKLHPVRLPDRTRRDRCIGSSSDGWVCLVDNSLDIYLFNPFSGSVVLLPSLVSDVYVIKALWSGDPTDSIIIVLWMANHRMLFCRPGDAQWTVIKTPMLHVSDVIFYGEKLYMMGDKSFVVAFDFLNQRVEKQMRPKLEVLNNVLGKKMYLVAGPSGLLLIVRYLKFFENTTVGFKVVVKEFELDKTETRWVKTESLDDGMLFLGLITSMWLPNFQGYKGKSIYFTDDL